MCALPATGGMLCGHCLRHPMQFDRTCAALAYAFPVDKLIQALKFDEQFLLARRLAEAMQAHISVRPDAIVPMPLHPERLCQRGFNQSQELARPLAHHLDVPLLHACRRIRNTAPQSGLPWRERKKNLRKAFVCEQDLRGQHVAIVDDVMTTGASLNELARVLRQAGAREISAWVVARTLPHSR
jgi:ComF family protein